MDIAAQIAAALVPDPRTTLLAKGWRAIVFEHGQALAEPKGFDWFLRKTATPTGVRALIEPTEQPPSRSSDTFSLEFS